MKYKTVDRIAKLQDEIAELCAQMEVLKDQLKNRGDGEYEGREFVAVITTSERRSLDVERVKKYLTPRQLKRAMVKTTSTACRLRPIES